MITGGLIQKAKFILKHIGVDDEDAQGHFLSGGSPYAQSSMARRARPAASFETPVVYKQPRSSSEDNSAASEIKQQIDLLKLEIELVKIKSAAKLLESSGDNKPHMTVPGVAVWYEYVSSEGHMYYANHTTGM